MFRNYIKITFRNIIRQKTYSVINIAGLAVGMASFILIALWVQDEISYDRFHTQIDNLYRVVDYEKYSNGDEVFFSQNAALLGPILKDKYPEILEFTRYRRGSSRIVQFGDKKHSESDFGFTDPSFFKLFSYEIVKGNKETILSDPYSIAITEEMAEKYFGDSEAIGQVLRIDNRLDFRVSGILKKSPSNSHLQFKFLIPFETITEFGEKIDNWRTWAYGTYVLLNQHADYKIVSEKIKNVIQEHESDALATISLQPLTDIHLFSSHIWGLGGTGEFKYVIIFSAIAILILLTACINFMNLATARSTKRAKEVGLRKVIGANRKELIVQFLNESLFLSSIALLFSISLVNIALPYFNELAGKELAFSLNGQANILLLVLATAIATGLISGSYPALFLSSFKPVKVMKGALSLGSKGKGFRRVLVSFQFILTIMLIFGALVINRQLHFIKNQNPGYNKEQVIVVDFPAEINKSVAVLKNEISQNPDVLNITAASGQPNRIRMSSIFDEWQGRQDGQQFLGFLLFTDDDFKETFQMEMASGRFFSKTFTTDTGTVVINEAAARAMGIDEPLGKMIRKFKIIGIMKDFHFRSLHEKIGPLVVYYAETPEQYAFDNLLVKLSPGNPSEKIASFKKTWASVVPDSPLKYQFLDEQMERMYRTDIRVEKLINVFTGLALFIACLGLLGLASFIAEQRTKEIGVRKVLGAGVPSILALLSFEFVKWIMIAALIAWPLGWYAMNIWLQSFAYKIDIALWMFLISGSAALAIAMLTVSFQAIRASLANPVEALRYE